MPPLRSGISRIAGRTPAILYLQQPIGSMTDIRRALSHVKRAQENRKRRDMESLKTNLDSAERLLEGSLDTGDEE